MSAGAAFAPLGPLPASRGSSSGRCRAWRRHEAGRSSTTAQVLTSRPLSPSDPPVIPHRLACSHDFQTEGWSSGRSAIPAH